MNVLAAYFLLRSLQRNKFRMVKESLEWSQKLSQLTRTPMPKYEIPEELKHKFNKENI